MKVKRILGAALAAALALAVPATAAAASSDPSGYGFQAGKLGRTEESIPYAGMNYEGGEQGDNSAYSFRAGRVGKPWNTAE